MHKSRIFMIAAGIATALFLCPAMLTAAPEPEMPAAPEELPATPEQPAGTISGEIESIDTSTGALVVKANDDGPATTIGLDENTRVRVDGQRAKAEDLKPGQAVVVLTENRDGRVVARSVAASNTVATM
jgi:hypothetical protein